ncbi:blastula protease 10-like [Physella acuta]|uniref:blastula protease 10-like n=1 Tax=Physella acuta TaxID=109671 RepID=UPI0027DD4AAA|nr:blastula protease 10-like [Physella acuta]
MEVRSLLRDFTLLAILLLLTSQQTIGRSIDELIAGASASIGGYDFLMDVDAKEIRTELDMILTAEQYKALQDYANTAGDDASSERIKRKALLDSNSRWTNKRIPYKIAPNVFNANDLAEIQKAINEWQNYTCIKIEEARSTDTNFVYFDNGNGCYSYVGMNRGSQTLGLAGGCRYKGVVVHEMGHAVGFHHEQNRPDRDNHVEIITQNIPENLRYNFQKYPWSAVTTMEVPYDYKSVMHYGGRAFTQNGQLTIKTKDPVYQNVIGNREGLSFYDIKLANLMYTCDDKCQTKPVCPKESFVGKDCKCWCPGTPGNPINICSSTPGYTVTTAKPVTKTTVPGSGCNNMNPLCQDWADAGYCQINSYVKTYCKASCQTCEVAPTTTVAACRDIAQHCSFWKGQGHCESNYAMFMKENCALTCDTCGKLRNINPGARTDAPGVTGAGDDATVVSLNFLLIGLILLINVL